MEELISSLTHMNVDSAEVSEEEANFNAIYEKYSKMTDIREQEFNRMLDRSTWKGGYWDKVDLAMGLRWI